MFKPLFLAAAVLGSIAAPASAGVLVADLGTNTNFVAPAAPGGATFNFNSAAVPVGFTATYSLAGLVTGDTATSAEPGFSDGSQYLSVGAGGQAILQSAIGFQSISFFLGSIDVLNTVQVLDTAGGVISTFTGSNLTTPAPADGDQVISATNRRITFTRSDQDALIGGVRFSSQVNSGEVDNLVFAVPEPATWFMMLLGFGMIGLTMRSRRRRSAMVYA